MSNNPITQSKAFSVTSVMKNPKIVKLLEEALKAPAGSSKREQARSTLRSLMTLKNNMAGGDGMGGPGVMGVSDWNLPVTNTPQGVQQNLSVQPGAGDVASGAPLQGSESMQLQGSSYMPQATGELSHVGKPMSATAQPEAMPPEEKAITPGVPDPSTMTGTDQYGMAPYTDTRESAWDELPQEQFGTMIEALKSGVGPEAFAYQIMSSKEELKKLLPGVPEEDLPVGASLNNQINELRDNLKKQYQIDEQLENIRAMERKGLTIEKDMTAYIKGKDEYISQLDNMLDNAKDVRATVDMSNPGTADMMNNYITYLETMKGRQHNRYAQYVTDSINQYDTRLKILQDNYNSDKAMFLEEFNSTKPATEETYTFLKNALIDMYNNLDTMGDTQIKRETDYYNKEEARFNAMNTALESETDGNDRVPLSEWAVKANVADRPTYQLHDLLYSPAVPDWYREEKEKESTVLNQGILSEEELMAAWESWRGQLASQTNELADRQLADEIIAARAESVSNSLNNGDQTAMYKLISDIQAQTIMTETEISTELRKFGFSTYGYGASLSWAAPSGGVSAQQEDQQKTQEQAADIQKQIIDLQYGIDDDKKDKKKFLEKLLEVLPFAPYEFYQLLSSSKFSKLLSSFKK